MPKEYRIQYVTTDENGKENYSSGDRLVLFSLDKLAHELNTVAGYTHDYPNPVRVVLSFRESLPWTEVGYTLTPPQVTVEGLDA